MDLLRALGALMHTLLTDGVGPVLDAHAAPALYPFILAGLVAAFLACVGYAIFGKATITSTTQTGATAQTAPAPPQSALGGRLALQGFYLLVYVLGFYATWLAYSTPVDRLFNLPTSGVVVVIAALVHGLLSIVGPLVVVSMIIAQVGIPENRVYGSLFVLMSALIVFGWEAERWPTLLVVAGELGLVFFAAHSLTGVLTTPSMVYSPTTPWTSRQYTILSLLNLLGVGAVVALHSIVEPFLDLGLLVNLLCLFLCLIQLDELAQGVGGWLRGTSPTAITAAMPVRYFFTAPLAVVVGVLGAQLIFAPLLRNPGLTPLVWIVSTGAAAMYLVYRPLMDWAQARARLRAQEVTANTYREGHRTQAYQEAYRRAYPAALAEVQGNRTFGRWIVRGLDRATVDAAEQREAERIAKQRAEQAAGQVDKKAHDLGGAASQGIVGLPSSALLFFIAAAAFALLSEQFGLALTFGSNLAPLITWLLTQTADRLAFLRLPFLKGARTETPERLESIFGAANKASLRIASVVGLSVAALNYVLPAQGPLAGVFAELARLNLHFVLGTIQTLHVLGWVCAVLVLVGYLVCLEAIYRWRRYLAHPERWAQPAADVRQPVAARAS